MRLTGLTIQDIFQKNPNKTFLVGAGISTDTPSCLPMGRKMIKAIVKHICAVTEQEKIIDLESLRFEQLVEIVRDRVDPNLKLIDFYGQCDRPNFQHFFLADMIKKGHFVTTTNFDHLIEYALLRSGIPKKDVVPVITENDFIKFNNPLELYKKGKKVVYKIHGSTRNIITNENTSCSLITTIQAFGLNKEGLNVFQVEPFKKELFYNISKNRSLVVMGYSGSDDFDIVPTLKSLKNFTSIIWINHCSELFDKEQIYEIQLSRESNADKIALILKEIKKATRINKIYLVNTNTTQLIKRLLESIPEIEDEEFPLRIEDWLENYIELKDPIISYEVCHKIYRIFDMYEDALRCLKKIFDTAEKDGNLEWKAIALNNMGEIYRLKGNFTEALGNYDEAIKTCKEMGNTSLIIQILNNIGLILRVKGRYPEALKNYEKFLRLAIRTGDLSREATAYNNIGQIYEQMENYPEALTYYNKALKISERKGDLKSKALCINNISSLYRKRGDYTRALELLEEALKININLGNVSSELTQLINIGELYRLKGNYPIALNYLNKALKISDSLGELAKKATILSNLGQIYRIKGERSKALEKFKKALKMDENIGDLSGKANSLNNIGLIYYEQKKYTQALKCYQEALSINEKLNYISAQASVINNIALVYDDQKNYSKALRNYKKAFTLMEKIGDKATKAAIIGNIGDIYRIKGNYAGALNRCNEALLIYEQIGDLFGISNSYNNIGLICAQKGRYSEAMKMYKKSLKILTDMKLDNSPYIEKVKTNIQMLIRRKR
jgi:tetratricopeptide (TPR) repeat protein